MGKTRLIAETGAGQHGVAAAPPPRPFNGTRRFSPAATAPYGQPVNDSTGAYTSAATVLPITNPYVRAESKP